MNNSFQFVLRFFIGVAITVLALVALIFIGRYFQSLLAVILVGILFAILSTYWWTEQFLFWSANMMYYEAHPDQAPNDNRLFRWREQPLADTRRKQ